MAKKSTFAIKKIPVNDPLYADVPTVALSVLSSQLVNGFIEGTPDPEVPFITRKRPGLSTPFASLGTDYGIQGLWWWDARQRVVAVCDGVIYTISQQGVVTTLTGDPLNVTGRVVFCPANEDGTYLAMANGGNIVYTKDAATTVAITASTTGAPYSGLNGSPGISHLAYMDGYLLANLVGTPQFYWSAINDITTWSNSASTPQYATMESEPQTIMALDARFDEIRLLGSESIEYWYNNSASTVAGAPFAKYEGATTMRGTGSPYTFIFANNTHWFIDRERNICKLQVRSPEVVSNSFASVLQGIPQVNDAFILPLINDGKQLLACIFPSSATSVIYDLKNNSYVGQWSQWHSTLASFQPWSVASYCFCPAWGMHLAGDRANGNIYHIGLSYHSDNGSTIRMARRTGNVDHGTSRKKKSSIVRLKLQRGVGLPGEQPADDPPMMMYRHCDNNSQEWSQEETVSLGKTGDTESIVEFRRNGSYRTRMHEFTISDNVPVTIVDAEEEIEYLAR